LACSISRYISCASAPFGFGGLIALVGYMQKNLVEERGWFSKEDYLQGLAFCQLSPGPLAAQLAIYLGWLRGGVWGGTLTGITFIHAKSATTDSRRA
jgi:chromate transporter